MRPALDAEFPVLEQNATALEDDPGRPTPIAIFDIKSYEQQAMSALDDLGTTRLCSKLEIEELREMARPSSTPPDPPAKPADDREPAEEPGEHPEPAVEPPEAQPEPARTSAPADAGTTSLSE